MHLSVLALLGGLLCLACHAETFEDDLILKKMAEDSFKGEWYPLSNKVLPYEGFKMKNGLLCRDIEETVPFTGWYSQFDSHNKVRLLVSFMEGKRQGVFAEWDKNGSLRLTGEYFDGEKNGLYTEWNHDDVIISQRNYLIGKLHGVSNFWYDNGQKKLTSTFDHGLIMEAKGWLSNGDPCPYTRVKDGRGVILNFGDGFLEQLLQTPQDDRKAVSDSENNDRIKFGDLRIEY
jgi:antitoxin component YwqK of YwqJK toxin-antitoxin module